MSDDKELCRRLGLPDPETTRWVIRRKAAVVNAVRAGAIQLDDVCRMYRLSAEEFHGWEQAIKEHGVQGLRSTRTQIYRRTKPSK